MKDDRNSMRETVEKYRTNIETYEKKYKEGYGHEFPDGHVIRFYHKVLKHQFGITSGKVFDYGCGSGTHLKFFMNKGFEPWGIDTSSKAIEECRAKMPVFRYHFYDTIPVPAIERYIQEKDFDLMFSNQVLYYLNDKDMKEIIKQLYDMTREGGIFFASVIIKGTNDYYEKNIVETMKDGMSKVMVTGRLNELHFINFKTRKEYEELFKPFKKIYWGHYDIVLREDEGKGGHDIFIGKKEEKKTKTSKCDLCRKPTQNLHAIQVKGKTKMACDKCYNE